jgi:hypothetical protein
VLEVDVLEGWVCAVDEFLDHEGAQEDAVVGDDRLEVLQLPQLVDDVDVVDGLELWRVPGPGFGEVGDVDCVGPCRRGVVIVDDEEVLC